MKPKIYKRWGRWNLVEGDRVMTVWSCHVDLTLNDAIEYFQRKAGR